MNQLKAEATKAAKDANELLWDSIATFGGAIGVGVIVSLFLPGGVPFEGYIPGVASGIAGAIIWRRARRDN